LVETLTARALTHDDDTPVTWRLHLRHGSPRHQVLRVTRAKRADLLVLGTRGRGGLSFAFLGSVAGDVLRESPCDVLLVPPPSERRP
ncbi:MAG TPA: universal stress protein, partial [Accumulibacter sp.]|nr:universal stress protein [Accumulibacter sp.]